MARNREVGQKGLDLDQTQIARMAELMEADIARNPVNVALLGADRIMFAAEHLAHLIKQLFRG
jgi:hypothetical protein